MTNLSALSYVIKAQLPMFHLSFTIIKYHLGPLHHQLLPPSGALPVGSGLIMPGYDSDIHAANTVGSLVFVVSTHSWL